MNRENVHKLSDDELIDLYLETQSSYYYGILYDRYSSKVYSKCLSLLKNEYEAQDSAQDIFMKVFLNISKFNRKSRFSTWVYSITYNYCIDLIRKKKKENTVLTDEDKGVEEVAEEVSDTELFEIESSRLKRLLELIAIEDKEVLLMKYQQELSIKEIGQIINKSESAVKMKLKRAKHKIREKYRTLYSAA